MSLYHSPLGVTHTPLCFSLYLWWHACQSVWQAKRASPPAAPRSLNQTGLAWRGLIGGQSRQHEGSLAGGATGGNVETEWELSGGDLGTVTITAREQVYSFVCVFVLLQQIINADRYQQWATLHSLISLFSAVSLQTCLFWCGSCLALNSVTKKKSQHILMQSSGQETKQGRTECEMTGHDCPLVVKKVHYRADEGSGSYFSSWNWRSLEY